MTLYEALDVFDWLSEPVKLAVLEQFAVNAMTGCAARRAFIDAIQMFCCVHYYQPTPTVRHPDDPPPLSWDALEAAARIARI
jgi:hypothetical protein